RVLPDATDGASAAPARSPEGATRPGWLAAAAFAALSGSSQDASIASGTLWSAARKLETSWKRSPGARARHFMIASFKAGDMPCKGRGTFVNLLCRIEEMSSPANGLLPDISSYIVAPSA